MYRDHLLATLKTAHFFESAFNREQLYSFLKVPMERQTFDILLQELLDCREVIEHNDRLFESNGGGHLHTICEQKIGWSRKLFEKYQVYLKLIARLPWIRYMGLTGANAFESCRQEDDIDLFVITAPNRLWITYLAIVLFSKLLKKRHLLCVNYLIDENHLTVHNQNYYVAIQIMHMMSLYNADYKADLIEANSWIFNYLPNAKTYDCDRPYYLLFEPNRTAYTPPSSSLLNRLNQRIFQQYSDRLKRKYTDLIGTHLVLSEGVAKLHRIDHSQIYKEIHRDIAEVVQI